MPRKKTPTKSKPMVYSWPNPGTAAAHLPNGSVYRTDDEGKVTGRHDASGTWIDGVDPDDAAYLIAAGFVRE